jgi:hypothetical protein
MSKKGQEKGEGGGRRKENKGRKIKEGKKMRSNIFPLSVLHPVRRTNFLL